jgi:phage terminase large subunit
VSRASLSIPTAFRDLLFPHRYKAYYGGRGSAKSHSFVRALVARCAARPTRWLCCREIQNSISASVKQLLDDVIREAGLTNRAGTEPFFESLETEIRGANGTLITFAGLRTNPEKVKSMEGLDGAWVEEANSVSARSLELLRPTLRAERSELWFSWNPEHATDPVDAMFRGAAGPPHDAVVREVCWRDNPHFPLVLAREMRDDRSRDPDKYKHVWLGGYRAYSSARVFTNWRIAPVPPPPPSTVVRFGADWGFGDPSVLVRSWIVGRTLYVDYEAGGSGVEIDDLPAMFAGDDPQKPPRWKNTYRRPGVPGALRWQIRADSSRPDTISYVRARGFNIVPARKGPGSVEEGVEFLKSVDIVVDPRCTNMIDELASYSYKVDKRTEAVIPVLEDRKNHWIDALRYSHEGARRGQMAAVVVQRL